MSILGYYLPSNPIAMMRYNSHACENDLGTAVASAIKVFKN